MVVSLSEKSNPKLDLEVVVAFHFLPQIYWNLFYFCFWSNEC